MKQTKTLAEWEGSGLCLSEFLQVGDPVDDDLMMYFLEVLPPQTWTKSIIQIGEPADTNGKGEFTYATMKKIDNRWCYAGEVVTP